MAMDLPDFSAFAVESDEPALPDAPDFSSLAAPVEMPAAPEVPSTPLAPQYMDAIKGFEGFTPQASWDYKQHSVGYGTRARYPGEVIDEAEANRRFNEEIGKARKIVDDFAPDAPEGVKAALTSLTYNAGDEWTRSGLGMSVQAKDWLDAENRFRQYNKAGGQTLPGLVNRRNAEAEWFREGLSNQQLRPGAVPEPDLDGDLVQQLFSVPEDQRQNFLNRYLHKALGIPQDLRAPPGHVGQFGPDNSWQTPADVPPERNPARLPDFSQFGVPVGDEEDAPAAEADEPGIFGRIARGAQEGFETGLTGLELTGLTVSGAENKDLAEAIAASNKAESGPSKELEELQKRIQKAAEPSQGAWGRGEYLTSVKGVFDTILAAGGEFLSDPVTFAEFSAQALGTSVIPIASMIVGGVAGSVVPVFGTTGGSIAGGFTGSAALEFGLWMQQEITSKVAEAGGDPTDPAAVVAVIDDPDVKAEIMAEAASKGLTHAAIGAVLDRVSAGLLRYAPKTKVGGAAKTVGAGAAQVASEGLEEAGSQVAATGDFDVADVALETVGGAGAGIAQTGVLSAAEQAQRAASGVRGRKSKDTPPQEPEAAAQPSEPTGSAAQVPESVSQPAQPTPQPSAEPSPQDDIAILRAQGWSDEDIAGMDPAELAAEAQQARDQGVVASPQAVVPDRPSAEPISDLVAQAKDLRDKNTPRQAVWLPKASLDELSRDDKSRKAVLGAGYVVKDFDGQGGTLVAKNKATAQAAIEARDAGEDLQSIIGGLVGSGTGKPADGSAVVQQVTPEGDVTLESLVTEGELDQTVEDFQAPDKDVQVVSPEEALVRREELTSEASEEAPDFSSQGVELGSRVAPVSAETAEDVDAAGARVTEPTEAQAKAGNYKKGHVEFQGLKVSIETPKGGTLRGKDADGTPWEVPDMPAHYGYIKRTKGADGDQVDVYIGSNPASDRVYLIDQVDASTGEFDEHKVVLGTDSMEEAGTIYSRAFSDGRGPDRVGAVTEMSVDDFKAWLAGGQQTKPAGNLETTKAEPVKEPAAESADDLPDFSDLAVKSETSASKEPAAKPDKKPDKESRPAPYDGPPLSDEEIDNIVDLWKFIREVNARPKPVSLTSFVINGGGLVNDHDEVSHLTGGARGRPGLINKNGQSIDDAALRAWEAGYFPQVDRPSVSEFLEALQDDLHTGEVVPTQDLAALDDIEAAGRLEEELSDYGIRTDQFRSESTLRAHFGQKADKQGVEASEDDSEAEAEESTEPASQAAGEVDDIPFDVDPADRVPDSEIDAPTPKPFNEYGHYKGQRVRVIDNFGKLRFEGEVYGPSTGGAILVHEDGRIDGAYTRIESPLRVIPIDEKPQTADRSPDQLKDYTGQIINGYLDDGEVGSGEQDGARKRAFLADARGYLIKVAKILEGRGFRPYTVEKKGRKGTKVENKRAVSVNPGGVAVSGDVNLSLIDADDNGVFVKISDALAGPDGGISLMARKSTREDEFGTRSQNQWWPVDLTASELADRLEKLARGSVTETAKPAVHTEASGQTSLVPEPTTKDEIEAAIKAQGQKGGNEPMDIGMFGPDRDQTDLVDQAKVPRDDQGPRNVEPELSTEETQQEPTQTFSQRVVASGQGLPDFLGRAPDHPNYTGEVLIADLYDAFSDRFGGVTLDSFKADLERAIKDGELQAQTQNIMPGEPSYARAALSLTGEILKKHTVSVAPNKLFPNRTHPSYAAQAATEEDQVDRDDAGQPPRKAGWKEGNRDPNLVMKLDEDGEVIGSAIFDGNRWAAMDADGNVLGYGKTRGEAKEIVDKGGIPEAVETPQPEAAAAPEASQEEEAQPAAEEAQPEPLEALRDRLIGEGFKTIVEARKFARELGIEGTDKQLDETIETAVVAAARDLIASGNKRGRDTHTIYDRLVMLYGNQPNLGVRTSTSVANQAYSTPVPLAYIASRLARVANADVVYEPSAGNGALLIEAGPGNDTVYANELDPARADALEAQGFEVTTEDATKHKLPEQPDSVIMNPPFGAVREGGQSKQWAIDGWKTTQVDHAIALKGLEQMTDDGRAVLILGGVKAESIEERRKSYRGQAKREFYHRLYNAYNVVDHFTVDGDLYKKQGAGWPVDVIVIEGRGKSERPLPALTPPVILSSWDALKEKLPNERPEAIEAVSGSRSPDRAPASGGRPASGNEGGRPASVRGGSERLPADQQDEPADVRDSGDRGEPGSVRPDRERDTAKQPEVDRDGKRTDKLPNADRSRPRVKKEAKGGQIDYEPASRAGSLKALTPVNMADAGRAAMQRIEQRKGRVDQFVAEQLGYTEDELHNALSAEQIDAVAAAIYNIENGSAFIIGDQTGIGKGRQVAALLRYAMRKDKTPVLITEKPDLYGDMFRDMRDIGLQDMLGHEPRMFMTNTGVNIPLDEEALKWKEEYDAAVEARKEIKATADEMVAEGRSAEEIRKKTGLRRNKDGGWVYPDKLPSRRGKFLKSGTKERVESDMRAIMNGKGDFDVVFTTYDQMNTVKGESTERRRFLENVAHNALIVMDESHNAGGTGATEDLSAKDAPENRAEFARRLASIAWGVAFSSATYAKRPDVMDLYARTDMGKAVDDPKNLPALIQHGGVPMQQVVATMLSDAGQYMRRERSFEGVEYAVEGMPVDMAAYEQFSDAIRAVFQFDLAVQEVRGEIMEDILDSMGGATVRDSGVGEAAAHTTAFASVMHNIVNQMLLAIKATATAERAIAAHKAGEKPVIGLASTMESFIRDFAEVAGIEQGGDIDLDFGDVMRRYLSRTLRITIKDSEGKKKHHQIKVEDLPPSLQQMYQEASDLIESGNYDGLPISPIDWIRQKIADAGLRVAEVTGRSTMIDYSQSPPKFVARPKREIGPAGKRGSIAAFNRGALDVLILNRSGSTGVSMHASKDFKDQRRRRMIIAQAEANIDTHLQMLGRVHRTGQVIPPAYSQVVAEIPAEARPAAVLMGKMASLNANTTGARGSVFMGDSADFINEVGDRVVARIVSDEPEYLHALGDPLLEDPETGAPMAKDAAKRVTGRLTLLHPAKQTELLDKIQNAYKRELAELDALGENPLEAKTLDLQAKTIESTVVREGQGDSPFLSETKVEKVSVKAQGRAHAPSDIASKVAEFLKEKRTGDNPAADLTALEAKGRAWLEKEKKRVGDHARSWIDADVQTFSADTRAGVRERHMDALRRWFATIDVAYPGARVTLGMPIGDLEGIVMGVERTGKAKNPVALGSWDVRIAVPDGAREFIFPMSKLFPPSETKSEDEKGATIKPTRNTHAQLAPMFEEARKEGRETRFMVTGNILAGYEQIRGRGMIVNYTTDGGELKTGVLLGRDFSMEKFMKARSVRFTKTEQIGKFLDKQPSAKVTSTDGLVTLTRERGDWVIATDAKRGMGGRYFTDPGVRKAIAPNEFVKVGKLMRTELTRDLFMKAVDAIRKVGALFETKESQEIADEIVKGDRALAPGDRYDRMKASLREGNAVEIPEMAAAVLDVIRRNPRAKESNVKELAVKMLEPSPFDDAELILTLVDQDGKEYFYSDTFESVFKTQAVFDHLADGTPVVVFYQFDVVGDLFQSIRGQRAHEWVHALRRGGKLPGRVGRAGSEWDRLVSHAELLGVMQRARYDYLTSIGHPFASKVRDKRETLFETYYKSYSGRDDFREVMDQESVAHMAQLYAHGALSDDDIMPVKGLLDAIIEGDLDDATPQGIDPRTGRLSALTRGQVETVMRLYRGEPPNAKGGLGHHYTRSLARARGFAGPDGKVYFIDVPLDRMGELRPDRNNPATSFIVPADLRAARREFTGKRTAALHPSTLTDPLGFYSKLDDVLATFGPRDKVTADTLQQRGVKSSEMQARGIAKLLKDGAQPVERLRRVAARNPVELLEHVYEPAEVDPFSEESANEEVSGAHTKWEAYTLDPLNPTYRETVLHLPSVGDFDDLSRQVFDLVQEMDRIRQGAGIALQNAKPADRARYDELEKQIESLKKEMGRIQRSTFKNTHFPQENIIAHIRTAVTKDRSGRPVFLVEELQSDWGQKIRETGVRDDARIAELNDIIEPIDAAREEAATILGKVVARELAESYKRQGPAFVAMAIEASVEGGPAAGLSAQDQSRLRELAQTLRDGNQPWYLAHEERGRLIHVGLPGNPLVNTTDQWMTTAMRRIIKQAVDAGAEAITFTPGQVVAERFDKAVLAPKIQVFPEDTGVRKITPRGPKGTALAELSVDADGVVTALTGEAVIGEVDGKQLRDVVGKDLAERILKMTEPGVIDTDDLAIGGDGMKYAYDVMYPKAMGKILSKMDKSIKPETAKLFYKDRRGIEIEFTTFPVTDKIRAAVSKGQPLFALGPPADRPLRTTEDGYVLRLPFFEKWGDPRFEQSDRARALARLREIQQLDVRKAPWEELVRARQDINEITAQLFFTKADLSLESIAQYSDEVSFYTLEPLRTGDTMRKSLFSSDRLPDELVDFGREGRAAIDHIMSARRRGVTDLMRMGYDKEPRRRGADAARVGDTMRSGFYFKSGRLLRDVPDPLFDQGGLAVINWLTQAGVKRAEIEHFRLFEKFGNREPTTRDAFEKAIAERMFDFNRKTSWLNPERSPRDYEYGGTRAFSGPRIPGRGVYFERLMGFPKKLKGGAEFAPGSFKSPHWDAIMGGTWASWRGSVREVDGWGKMVVGEEGQTDFMQGATQRGNEWTVRRPRISQDEYLRLKGMRDSYNEVMGEAYRLVRGVINRTELDHEVARDLASRLSPSSWSGQELEFDAWMGALSELRDLVTDPDANVDLTRLEELRIAYDEFFAPGARNKFALTESKFTPETPLDQSYVRTMVRDLLMLVAQRKADSVAISTSETTARIQNNDRAAHFYDAQLKPAMERELRRITGDGSIKMELVKLPKAIGAPRNEKAYTVWAAKLTSEQRAKITDNGQPMLSAAPSIKIDTKEAIALQEEVSQAINIVNRIAGPQVDVVFDPTIGTEGNISREQLEATEAALGAPIARTIGGYYAPKTLRAQAVIGLAFNDPLYDLRTTAGHEAYHHVEEALASPAELKLLNSESEMNRIRRMAAPELGLDPEDLRAMQPWEVRAAAFQRYRREREEGAPTSGLHIGVRRFFDRLNRIFRNVLNALRGNGYGSFEDIFERARTGEMVERVASHRAGARTGTVSMSGDEAMASARASAPATETEAFRRWFADSKVVDKNGRPLVVYHGTLANIEVFDEGRRGAMTNAPSAKMGFFFTNRPKTGSYYSAGDFGNIDSASRYRASERRHLELMLDVSHETGNRDGAADYQNRLASHAGPNVMPVYLSIQNPLVHDFKGRVFRDETYANLIEKARQAGHDGVILKNTYDAGEYGRIDAISQGRFRPEDIYVAFRPEQIKSATGNRGTFDPTDPNIMANVIPTPSTMFPGRGPGLLRRRAERLLNRAAPVVDRWRVALQDKALPIRRVAVERIEDEIGAKLPVNLDTYVAEALYYGRAGERMTDLKQKQIDPLIEALRKSEIKINELGDYLYARHAAERNAAIAEIDPDNEAGSGMTDEEASEILDRVAKSGKQEQYEEAAAMVDSILDETRKTLLQAGLLDRETYDQWRAKYQHYVPLRGFEMGEEENPDAPRTGRGFDVRGPEAMRALGRRSKADNPVIYAVMQAQQAIVRAEKNRVAKTLYRTIQSHPNDAIWKIYKGEYKRRINPQTGLVETYWVPPAFTRNENVHAVKIGGKQHWMELKHPGLARAMRGVGSEIQGTILGRGLQTVTRMYASLLTSYNPEFVVSNLFRDIETALVNVTDVAEKPAGVRKQIIKEAFSAKSIRGIMNALRGDGQSEYAKWFEEFRLAGGKISYMEYNDVERIKKRINASMKEGNMRRTLRNAARLIEDMNTSVENGVRLSVYIALRKNGIAKDRAAFVARELTVNFNRKGEFGPLINSAYLFFNASAQGTVRMAQAITRSKAVRYALAGIFAAGFGLDLLNFLIAGDDDDGENHYDKIPDWIKERNLIFMLPFGKGDDYVMIPMAYGYNVPYLAGQKAMSVVRNAAGLGRGTNPFEAAVSVTSTAAESFNPIGSAASFWQYVSPTLLDPGIQVLENKTWYGGPIYPTKFDKREPWSETYFSSAPWWSKEIARLLNEGTGGNQARPGAIDISPETIQHYVEFAGGGVGKFVVNAWNAGERFFAGDEWLPETTPFVRRVYGKATTQSRLRDFYEVWNEVDAARYEFTELSKAGLKDEAKAVRDRYEVEIKAYGSMRATYKKLRTLRKKRDEINESGLPRSIKLGKMEEIIKQENAIILKALGNYNKLRKEHDKENKGASGWGAFFIDGAE